MKRCGSCFRYCENWRDARAKGLQERFTGLGDYHYKPRKGIKPHCIGGGFPGEEIHEKHTPCKYHEYRGVWNLKTWWSWHFKQRLAELYRRYIRVPIGGRRKPVPLKWTDYYNGMADKIIKNGEPVCPHCDEMPYSYKQCVFCGQRFTQEDIDHG